MKKRYLAVGINDYSDFDPSGKFNLGSCAADTESMKECWSLPSALFIDRQHVFEQHLFMQRRANHRVDLPEHASTSVT
jgi:hypothetical protein